MPDRMDTEFDARSLPERIRSFTQVEDTYRDNDMEDPTLIAAAKEIDANMTYLGGDDVLIEIAAEVEAIQKRERELMLRVADAYSFLCARMPSGETNTSVLEHILKGDPGHMEPEEFQRARQEALTEHGPRLQWGEPTITEVEEG